MAGAKRKRLEETTAADDETNGEINHNVSESSEPPATVSEECPYNVQILRDGSSAPKKRKQSILGKSAGDQWTSVKLEPHISPDQPPVAYAVAPREPWDAMKKYKFFEVAGIGRLGIGDFIYINNGQYQQNASFDDEAKLWVAQVLEIRAANSAEVFLRVFWMYWPEELPMDRQPYHGTHEVVASNSMEILDALTVANVAEVLRVVESDDYTLPVVDTLYWRQTLDTRTNKLSQLKCDCICKQPHNPDKLLIRCTRPSCTRWQHETCLVNDALHRHWKSKTSPAPATPSAETPSDTIRVTPRSSTSSKKPTKKKDDFDGWAHNRRRSSFSRQKAGRKPKQSSKEPWSGMFEGSLQRPHGESGKQTGEITGKVLIKRLSNEEKLENAESSREEDNVVEAVAALCLFCHEPIFSGPETSEGDGDGQIVLRDTKQSALAKEDSEAAAAKGQDSNDKENEQDGNGKKAKEEPAEIRDHLPNGEFTASQKKAAGVLLDAAREPEDKKESSVFTPPDERPAVVGII